MKTLVTLLNVALAFTCVSAMATDQAPDSKKVPIAATGHMSPKADNTDVNERDKSGATKTPQDQSNREQDRMLLASVRSAIVGDKSLSILAHNAKVMVESGVVTLRGPVQSAEERARVESVTKQIKGVSKIDNQLDVKTKS